MARWDVTTPFALIFTAIVTPYEVGEWQQMIPPVHNNPRNWLRLILSSSRQVAVMTPHPASDSFATVVQDPLWDINRIVDLIFVVDMFIAMHTMYRTPKSEGAQLIKNLEKVRKQAKKLWICQTTYILRAREKPPV